MSVSKPQLEAAIAAYPTWEGHVTDLCYRHGISTSTLYHALLRRGIPRHHRTQRAESLYDAPRRVHRKARHSDVRPRLTQDEMRKLAERYCLPSTEVPVSEEEPFIAPIPRSRLMAGR
jgi:hypothetical protein